MRAFVEPPPSSCCTFCSGELRLKLIESATCTRDLDNEIFICVTCEREQLFIVNHRNRTHKVA